MDLEVFADGISKEDIGSDVPHRTACRGVIK